ncbi:MAG: HzsA-related protein, partial [Planctomycetota bacterium]
MRAALSNRVLVGCAAVFALSPCAPAGAARERNTPATLRAAIDDLVATFGERYPKGREFLARLGRADMNDREALGALRREALVANPLVSGAPILFVTRHQYRNEHGTEATMYQTGEVNTHCFRGGGALKVLELPRGKVTTILEAPEGVARDPEVHFDGKRILFSMRRDIKDDYHIHEIDIDGGNPRQLTFGPRVSDIQPVYMPDGKIVFSSTREPKYIPCQRHLMANLFTMNGDGSNIRQIGHNTQFEGRASLMGDGRVLYTRWEYVDKHFASAYGLWTANPDGTNHALYYGGYAWQPGTIVDARAVPGTGRFVAVFTAVHELAWGAMVIGDRSRGLDGPGPVLRSWPADISGFMRHWAREERIGGGYDSFRGVRVKYEDPYPLSGKYFLCSRQLGHRRHMGLFLVDVFGNEVLLHEEAPGCFDPMPIAPRARPPVIPPKINLRQSDGTFYVRDVYVGEFMDRLERGSVKHIRVVEAPPKRTFPPWKIGDWTPSQSADSHHPVALNWNHYNNKRILGRAPVERDGSAYFEVPAGRFVYFQLLDENGM